MNKKNKKGKVGLLQEIHDPNEFRQGISTVEAVEKSVESVNKLMYRTEFSTVKDTAR